MRLAIDQPREGDDVERIQRRQRVRIDPAGGGAAVDLHACHASRFKRRLGRVGLGAVLEQDIEGDPVADDRGARARKRKSRRRGAGAQQRIELARRFREIDQVEKDRVSVRIGRSHGSLLSNPVSPVTSGMESRAEQSQPSRRLTASRRKIYSPAAARIVAPRKAFAAGVSPQTKKPSAVAQTSWL